MKKKIMGIIAVVAIAAVAGYSVYTSQNNVKLSDLTLNNIEALASSNESGSNYCRMNNVWYCVPWGSGSACYCYM